MRNWKGRGSPGGCWLVGWWLLPLAGVGLGATAGSPVLHHLCHCQMPETTWHVGLLASFELPWHATESGCRMSPSRGTIWTRCAWWEYDSVQQPVALICCDEHTVALICCSHLLHHIIHL